MAGTQDWSVVHYYYPATTFSFEGGKLAIYDGIGK
jgi:hypothetical protein